MGLAGRKQKQRIPNDPRNLSWADDASRFGLSYLSKFGWDSSQGLGSSGDGIKTHVKVQQKLDMLGIGGQHQRDPNGIAWKQNKDFEALLRRLNAGQDGGEDEDETRSQTALNGAFMRGQEDEDKVEEEEDEKDEIPTTKKKRKHRDTDDTSTNESKKKKHKKDRKKEKHEKSDVGSSSQPHSSTFHSTSPERSSKPLTPDGSIATTKPKARPMAHRARIRAAKSLANKSASAIAEILGIAPSNSTSTSTPETPSSTPTQSLSTTTTTTTTTTTPTFTTQPTLSLDNLTTSTKSVADYFKEKLLTRTSSFSSAMPSSGSTTPGLGASRLGFNALRLGSSNSDPSTPADEDEQPRRGIGSRDSASTSTAPHPEAGPSSSSLPSDHEDKSEIDSAITLTEKQRRKAERKTEKQKRREEKAQVVKTSGEFKKAHKKDQEGKCGEGEQRPDVDDGADANSETHKRHKTETDIPPQRAHKKKKNRS